MKERSSAKYTVDDCRFLAAKKRDLLKKHVIKIFNWPRCFGKRAPQHFSSIGNRHLRRQQWASERELTRGVKGKITFSEWEIRKWATSVHP
jgi:hypothetical protein